MLVSKRTVGFTIVELLIVVVVIAILAAISTVAYTGFQTRAKASRVASDLRNVSTAVSMYAADNGRLPCFDHSWSDVTETNWSSQYTKWPKTPQGTTYHWEHVYGGLSYSISIDSPGAGLAQAIDTALDDGNLAAGKVRGSAIRLEYVIESAQPTSHPGDDC